jgi:hypothetical protein
MRRTALILLLAGLSACSGASNWSRAGASPETTRADLEACRSEANAATRQDQGIDADIMATRGQDWQRTGTLGAKRETLAMQNQGRASDIVELCMRSKGYSPTPSP